MVPTDIKSFVFETEAIPPGAASLLKRTRSLEQRYRGEHTCLMAQVDCDCDQLVRLIVHKRAQIQP